VTTNRPLKARATTFGAISVINAIASGKGATASVRLTTHVEVELHEDSRREWEVLVNGRGVESRLAIESARRAIEGLGKDSASFSGRIATSSTIPIGIGLKTSSSSSTAIALAVREALGAGAFDPKKVFDCSIEASLASGASITGALDDAASCLLGGLNMTENLSRKVISSRLFERKLKVMILVPRERGGGRGRVDPQFIRKFGGLADTFFRMSLEGDPWKAMILNGLMFSSILKYDPFPALHAVELGALGAGLSGTGPAVAAVFDPSRQSEMDALAKDWAADGSEVILTETNNEHGRATRVD
jgi:shikimate kinase